MDYNCIYYDEKRNYCIHYKIGGQCRKLLMTCALEDKLSEGIKDE